MSLVEALSAPRVPQPSPCLYARLRATLCAEEQEALDSALEKIKADEGSSSRRVYSVRWLVKVLRTEGHTVSEATVIRHKNGSCSCGTDGLTD